MHKYKKAITCYLFSGIDFDNQRQRYSRSRKWKRLRRKKLKRMLDRDMRKGYFDV